MTENVKLSFEYGAYHNNELFVDSAMCTKM